MKYNLNELQANAPKSSTWSSLGKLLQLISHERKNLWMALIAILVNSGLNLYAWYLIGKTIDKYIFTAHKDYHGVLVSCGILLAMYAVAFFSSYFQTILMGGVGQRMLFTLRNAIFNKLQILPVGFFNQNKAGDLISRINNDTDKLNQFFSQSLMQFIGSIVTMLGAGIFLLSVKLTLGAATLVPAAVILAFTMLTSPWVKRKNAKNLKSVGGLSAEIQESLNNFKVIIAFNRRDYFRKRFAEANNDNYQTAIGAGIANNSFVPVYGLFSSMAQLVVFAYGIYLISIKQFEAGLLISYFSYANQFYNPLRQLAALWTSFQTAMAAWDRISHILALETDLVTVKSGVTEPSSSLLEFRNVHFSYDESREILHNISFKLEKGKTYALVGPTGGGKTTTASLIARLYDTNKGTVLLDGKDIRSYEPLERTQKIGFILQEPFLFTGTVRENILYGNELYVNHTSEQLEQVILDANLGSLLAIFEQGLDTKVLSNSDGISLGQKQLIAFMRAVLRNPELLILDEATANIDTITEKLLSDILNNLPATTTRVIIAHRLNTIENADEIYFVNSGEVILAGSFDHAMEMLLHGKRVS
ncbi:ABC transporter ATP-binding protein [Mucilaginibacter gotjawali]|uniref:ATP-binding cassette subfamily B protein n=2 Tax=Mucilaginibacter gotjawali TaxID=1550579 RepID=A0A839S8E3_9SPHI|nr:ABC transporter ATP-binding protein [Mucilaginibacter gotjawali]MBB3053634.1 ATP-binding cassette subfamily B protein [Mucilaginibacter gotjawali]BAU53893.1 putative ABC transporter ATP-binding protein [Mucilaginibacter gotjawali]